MIKVVLFDLDGTLLNRDASVVKFIENQYDRFNLHLGHIKKETYTSRFIELDKRGYVWKDIVFKQLIDEYSLKELTMTELLNDYLVEFKNHCVPFLHLTSMLETLKNSSFRLGIISNGKTQFQLDNIKALGIEDFFEWILISEKEGISKPDEAIFKKAIKYFNVSPEECVFIGDHPDNDYYGAQNAGMRVIWKKDPQWFSFNAKLFIDDLSELPNLINQLAIK